MGSKAKKTDSLDRQAEIRDLASAIEQKLSVDDCQLQPFYHEVKNEIIQSDMVQVLSRYFLSRWSPELGPVTTLIIMRLRAYCYYNKVTGETRDWCFPSMSKLASEIGVSTRTVERALNPTDKKKSFLLEQFIRREHRYVYDAKAGKKRRTSDMYHVSMDDPIHPDDEAELKRKTADRLAKAEHTADIHVLFDSNNIAPTRQNGGKVPPTRQIDGYIYPDKLTEEEVLLRDSSTATAQPSCSDDISPRRDRSAAVAAVRSLFRNQISERLIHQIIDDTSLENLCNQLAWFKHRDASWARKGPVAAFVAYCRQEASEPDSLAAARKRLETAVTNTEDASLKEAYQSFLDDEYILARTSLTDEDLAVLKAQVSDDLRPMGLGDNENSKVFLALLREKILKRSCVPSFTVWKSK